jgi:4-diphosphocytidyl-2-C-methyl-D-erythritol kinase
MAVSVFSPAKLNLFLAITGRRGDGFHDLVSVAAPLDFGDQLEAETGGQRAADKAGAAGNGGRFTLSCDRPDVPVDGTNLILRAADAFAAASGWMGRVDFKLAKRIPIGAGLGGGSSNAVAALRALNELSGTVLGGPELAAIARSLGSDCPLFLHPSPVVMRGRGEHIDVLPATAAARIRGRRVLLFKPGFGISTPWAYGRMAAGPGRYLPPPAAEAQLSAWLQGDAPVEELLFNNMEGVAFEKFVALPVLLEKLRRDFGVAARMSGSGSACFALLAEGQAVAPLADAIRTAWGSGAFVQEARLA